MTQQAVPRVFLSYSTKDRKVVRDIYKTLAQEETIIPWFDEKILLPGLEWEREISKVVWETDIILVCFSPKAMTSKGGLDDEIRYALAVGEKRGEARPPIIVLKLEAGELPESLQQYPVIDRYEKYWQEQLIELLHAQDISRRPPPLVAPAPPPSPPSEGDATEDAEIASPRSAESRLSSSPARSAPTGGSRSVSSGTSAQGERARNAQPEVTERKPSEPQGKITMNVPRGRSTSSSSTEPKSPMMWLRYTIGIVISLVIIAAVVMLWKKGPDLLADETLQGPVSITQVSHPLPTISPPSEEDAFEQVAPMLPTKSLTPTMVLTSTTMLELAPTITPTFGLELAPTITPTIALEPTPTITPTMLIEPTAVITPTDTPEPTIPPPPPPPVRYTVRSGDTIRGIAASHGLSVEELLALNNMSRRDADNIYPGQEIIVSR